MAANILKANFNGNSNIGLYAYCLTHNDKKIILLGENVGEETEKELSKTLDAEIVHLKIAGTPLLGAFLAGNSKNLLVPAIAFDSEIAKLKKIGVPFEIIKTNLTCLGNNIVCNDHGALINPEFKDKEIAIIEEALGVKTKKIKIADLEGPGACIVTNNKHGIIHRDAETFEIEMAKKTLDLESLEPCSVNMGSPYLKSGLIVNEAGFVIGEQSGGPEIIYVEENLGY